MTNHKPIPPPPPPKPPVKLQTTQTTSKASVLIQELETQQPFDQYEQDTIRSFLAADDVKKSLVDPNGIRTNAHEKRKEDIKADITALTRTSLYNEIMQTTLKPVHASDPYVIRFITNYTLCNDVRQAAKEAGLNARDGRVLISYPDVYECVQKIANMNARKYGYDAEEVVSKVREVIDIDPADLFNPNTGGYFEDINDIPPETRRAIKKFHVMNVYDKDENGVVTGISGKILKIEFWDKLKAAELLGSEKDVFKKQVKVEHDVGVNMRDTLLGRLRDAEEQRELIMRDVTHE